MTSGSGVARGRCVHCKVEISVPDQYAHGDHIKCGGCGTKHKVVRGDRLRLVLADIGPMRDALAQNEQLTTRLEAELAHARGSFGIGANGFGIALIYALYQVGMRGEPIGKGLVIEIVVVALLSGVTLELLNWAFLAKRHRITTLTSELEEARSDATRLRTIIREATRL